MCIHEPAEDVVAAAVTFDEYRSVLQHFPCGRSSGSAIGLALIEAEGADPERCTVFEDETDFVGSRTVEIGIVIP